MKKLRGIMKFYTQTLDILKTTSEFLCLKMTQLWMLQVAWGFTNEDYGVAPMVPDSTVAQSTLHRCRTVEIWRFSKMGIAHDTPALAHPLKST